MNERQQKIMEILEVKKSIPIHYLCDTLLYSRSTIRRDLIELEEMGLIRREKGLVNLKVGRTKERSFKLRKLENVEKKYNLCAVAKDFITEGMSLFLDASSTVLQIVPLLKEYDDLTVVTNGIEVAYELIQMPNIELFIVGGYVREGTSAIVGETALDYISQFHLDLCIFSCNGLDEEGVYEPSMQQAVTKRQMIDHAELRILLCDGSKLEKKFKYKLMDYKDVDYIISDGEFSETWIKRLKDMECEILKAESSY
ncbi:MAG: DeoR/GlpR family DNA-binding transcription regulator [Cellulosilyticaceae bacterium]